MFSPLTSIGGEVSSAVSPAELPEASTYIKLPPVLSIKGPLPLVGPVLLGIHLKGSEPLLTGGKDVQHWLMPLPALFPLATQPKAVLSKSSKNGAVKVTQGVKKDTGPAVSL